MIEEFPYDQPAKPSNTRMENILALVTFGITLIFLFSPSIYFLRKLNPYTIHFLFFLLLLGFIAFITDRSKLMIASLLSVGALCLFLKSTFNQNLKLENAGNDQTLQVAHISLGNVDADRKEVIEYLIHLPIDVICIQELSPDWENYFNAELEKIYPYSIRLPRMDQYGQGMYSKLPLSDLDTMWVDQIPAISAKVDFDSGHSLYVLSCQVTPPVNQAAFDEIESHFSALSAYSKKLNKPLLLLGEFHLPSWSSEVQKLKSDAQLNDSRRDIHSRNLDGSVSFPRIPVDYILFSKEINCSSFSDLGNSLVGRLGITGTYYFQSGNDKMAN